MAGEKSGMKRFGFKRTTTSDHITTTTTELSDLGEGSSAAAVDAKLDATFSGHKKSDHSEAIRNLSEVEANRRLSTFKEEHSFDPNLPDVALDAIKDATQQHDRKGEAILVDEMINDSPYPEVRGIVLSSRERC